MSYPGLSVSLVANETSAREDIMIIDCGRCEARGLACANCAAAVLVTDSAEAGHPYPSQPDLGPAELRALTVLANAGLIPPLRYAPRMARAS
jgi:hypothetical protein